MLMRRTVTSFIAGSRKAVDCISGNEGTEENSFFKMSLQDTYKLPSDTNDPEMHLVAS